jgi:aconitate decarboxylase
MGITAALCEKIVATEFGDLTQEAVAAARRLVLDGISVAVAGSRETAIRILADHYRSLEGRPDAVALGLGFRTTTISAAALNRAAMHVLDFEPMWTPATHALSTTLPAILALAEPRRLSGRDIVTALVKGIEIQGWIRAAQHNQEHGAVRFHPPGLVGPMGSAVAAGHVLGLDASQLAYALGMSASRAGSVLANAGTMTKSTHCGQAAMLGMEAAMLAARGFTATAEAFEAPQGYAYAFYGDDFFPQDLLNFGPPFRVVEPGFVVKLFPSQFATQFVITAGLELHAQISDAAAIRAVRLRAPRMPYINRPRPQTGLDGKFSVQYTLCAALLRGAVRIDSFTDDAVHAPDIVAVLDKVSVEMVADIPARFDKMHVEAEVELADGRVLRARCDGPRGMWGTAQLSDEEHLVKVRDCLSKLLPPEKMERCIALARSIDRLGPREVVELLAIAGCGE